MSSKSEAFRTATEYLKKKLFARIGIVTMLALLCALAALFYYLTYKAAAESNKSKLIMAQGASQAVLDKVDRNFYERFGDVQAFAFNKLAIETARNDSATIEAQEFINTMTRYYVLYDLMMICNTEGKVLITNTVDKNGTAVDNQNILLENFKDTDWFDACVNSPTGPEGGAWFSDFIINEDVAKLYGKEGYGMAFAAPIKDESGSVIGAWYNFASWEDVTEGIRVETENHLRKTDPEAQVIITRRTGETISSSNKELMKKEIVIDTISVLQASNMATYFNDKLTLHDYVIGWGKSKGAYTFKGKQWISATLIPRSTISWRIFFSWENFPAIAASLIVMIAISFLVFQYFNKHVITRIGFIQSVLERMSKGDAVEIHASMHNPDEIGSMIGQLSALADMIKQKAAFADEIAKGNFNATIAEVNENDVLGTSLINMRNQLKTTREEDTQRNWATEGLAQIGTLLRTKSSASELYDQIISFIVKYMKATQGGLFLQIKKDNALYLELVACFAYERKKFIEKQILVGTGLAGQCALEMKTIYLTDVPTNYLNITSGLGTANPRSLLIVPLLANEEILGILEIASFRTYNSFEIEFMEKIAQSIAAVVSNIRIEENTQHLLNKAQQQAEQMKQQEDFMRQNMEELSGAQEEMERKEKEYKARIKLLEEKIGNYEPVNK